MSPIHPTHYCTLQFARELHCQHLKPLFPTTRPRSNLEAAVPLESSRPFLDTPRASSASAEAASAARSRQCPCALAPCHDCGAGPARRCRGRGREPSDSLRLSCRRYYSAEGACHLCCWPGTRALLDGDLARLAACAPWRRCSRMPAKRASLHLLHLGLGNSQATQPPWPLARLPRLVLSGRRRWQHLR